MAETANKEAAKRSSGPIFVCIRVTPLPEGQAALLEQVARAVESRMFISPSGLIHRPSRYRQVRLPLAVAVSVHPQFKVVLERWLCGGRWAAPGRVGSGEKMVDLDRVIKSMDPRLFERTVQIALMANKVFAYHELERPPMKCFAGGPQDLSDAPS
jgi:hypothetical protein